MSTTAKFTHRCSECQQYIVAGRDQISTLMPEGTVWIHEQCRINFWNEHRHNKRKEEERENNG